MAFIRLAVLTLLGVLLLTPAPASAQVFGTFSWQMLPYCNVVSLTLVNTPAGFTLQGTDDQCGAVNKAAAFGVASFSAAGTVTANFTIVAAPDGKPVHVSAIISPVNGNGTWTDSAGNTGSFALSGATPGLPPRPLPPSGLAVASVTAREIAPDAVTGLSVQNGSLTSVDLADAPRAASVAGTQNLTLAVGVPTNVRQITLTAPAPGRVIVTVSASVTAASAASDKANCSLTMGTVVEAAFTAAVGESASLPAGVFFPLGMTRGFGVNTGPVTVRLVCQSVTGVVSVHDTAMTAAYFPH